LLLSSKAMYAASEPLCRHQLRIYEKSHGPDHPIVAFHLESLASVLKAANRLSEAEPLYRRALAIEENTLTLTKLALLLEATNRLSEAEPVYRRALAIDEKSYGPDHPDVATDLNNLAHLLRATNRLSEAEPLYRRALGILVQFTRATGRQHPHLEKARANYARALTALGRSKAEVEAALRSAL
jgi:tetratricopeptide (TPR) repeat protein